MSYVAPLTRMSVVKHSTKEAHLETEKIFIPTLKNIRKEEDYVHILKMFYGFYSSLHHSVFPFLTTQFLPDSKERRTPDWIIHDIAAMSGNAEIICCTDLPEIKNFAQAFGALYVMEGSTLGGEIIVQMLKKNEHLNLPEHAFSFFSAYGEKNAIMWRKFGDHFEEAITTDEALQQAIDTANETFQKLKLWMLNYN